MPRRGRRLVRMCGATGRRLRPGPRPTRRIAYWGCLTGGRQSYRYGPYLAQPKLAALRQEVDTVLREMWSPTQNNGGGKRKKCKCPISDIGQSFSLWFLENSS